MKHLFRWMAAVAVVALVAACSAPDDLAADWSTWEDGYAELTATYGSEPTLSTSARGGTPERYILSTNGVLRGVEAAAARRGDVLVQHAPQAGFAVVETTDPRAYARFANVIVRDPRFVAAPPKRVVPFEESGVTSQEVDGPTDADDLLWLLWGVDAVNAPEAWAAGVVGQGTTVAVIDGGFFPAHPDLEPHVDMRSMSFVASEELEFCHPDSDYSWVLEPEDDNECDELVWFSHGTHVAGTVGAVFGGGRLVGVAPATNLLLLKALSDQGSGAFGDVMAAIVYAALNGADVANMSLGGGFFQSLAGSEGAALRVAMQRVANFATWTGTLLVASAGNSALDLDKTADLLVLPSGLQRVVSVSATGPTGWIYDPTVDVNVLASYSNYGRSAIDVSAPGGDFQLVFVGDENWFYDMVLSPSTYRPSSGAYGYAFSVGTSMAAPHASGVAALILSELGGSGSLKPAQLERELIRRASDLGEPGRDPAHGMGAVRSGY